MQQIGQRSVSQSARTRPDPGPQLTNEAPANRLPCIETKRLILRPLTPDDLGDLHRQLSDARVMRYYPSVLSLEQSREWLGKILADYDANGFGMLAVTLKETSEFIGQAGVMRRDADETVHYYLAYLLLSEFWGHGYATEAVGSLIGYAFETLLAPVVEALIRPENEPSLRVATRVRMRQTGTTMHAGFIHAVYSFTPEDMQSSALFGAGDSA